MHDEQRELVVVGAGVLGRVAGGDRRADHDVAEQQRRLGALGARRGRRARWCSASGERPGSTSSSSSGKASTSVGPVVAHEPLVELGDGRPRRRTAPTARRRRARPRRRARARPARASGRRRPGRAACSSATNTSSAALGRRAPAPLGRRRTGGHQLAGRRSSAGRRLGRPLVGVDDVLHDAVAHDVAAGEVHEREAVDARRGSARGRRGRLRPPGTSTWVTSPVTTDLASRSRCG